MCRDGSSEKSRKHASNKQNLQKGSAVILVKPTRYFNLPSFASAPQGTPQHPPVSSPMLMVSRPSAKASSSERPTTFTVPTGVLIEISPRSPWVLVLLLGSALIASSTAEISAVSVAATACAASFSRWSSIACKSSGEMTCGEPLVLVVVVSVALVTVVDTKEVLVALVAVELVAV